MDGNGTHRLRVHSPDGTAPSLWLTSMDREALSGSSVDHWEELTS